MSILCLYIRSFLWSILKWISVIKNIKNPIYLIIQLIRLLFILSTTDVAGGYSSSMLDAIRRAVMVSNILLINKINAKSLTLNEVFRLATLGGSQGNEHFLSLSHNVQPYQSMSVAEVWRLMMLTSACIPIFMICISHNIPKV